LKLLSHPSENLKRCRPAARTAAPHMNPDGFRISGLFPGINCARPAHVADTCAAEPELCYAIQDRSKRSRVEAQGSGSAH
jgi:hypothetical protein